jgi:hypothetical protein
VVILQGADPNKSIFVVAKTAIISILVVGMMIAFWAYNNARDKGFKDASQLAVTLIDALARADTSSVSNRPIPPPNYRTPPSIEIPVVQSEWVRKGRDTWTASWRVVIASSQFFDANIRYEWYDSNGAYLKQSMDYSIPIRKGRNEIKYLDQVEPTIARQCAKVDISVYVSP